jgi:hypothetical protein
MYGMFLLRILMGVVCGMVLLRILWSVVIGDLPQWTTNEDAANDSFGFMTSTSVAAGAPDNHMHHKTNDGDLSGGGNSSSWILQVGVDIKGEASEDYFGCSVAMSADGSRVAIGAGRQGSSSGPGHVRIFDWNGSRWKRVGSDWDRSVVEHSSYASFGTPVALSADGNRLAFGAFEESYDGMGSGHVLLYDWNGTHWTQVGSNLVGQIGYLFGWSLALSADGNRVAVGAFGGDKDSGEETGLVYIYHLTGTRWKHWTQMGSTLEGDAAGDSFGQSVALSADGNRLAVGTAPSGDNRDAGYVRIYDWTGSQWTQVGSDLDSAAHIRLHNSIVALSEDGTRVVVGGRGRRYKKYDYEDDAEVAGHVRVYDWTGSQWIQVGSDVDGVSLGWSIALSADGNRLASGAPFKGGDIENRRLMYPGVVHIYDWTGSQWRQVGSELQGKLEGEWFGSSIALSANGSRVAIGASDHGNIYLDGVVSAGKMRVYDLFQSLA